jgi:uncharacterized membrane protein
MDKPAAFAMGFWRIGIMITTPPGWGARVITQAYNSITSVNPASSQRASAVPEVARIHVSDLRWALERGMQDFGSSRTDVIFLCVIYPLLGLLLARVASGYDLLPLVFPLASGFALVGPQPPASLSSFVNDVLFTHAGRTMMVLGIGSGFVFAVVALMISAVTFPMLLDRNVPLETAVRTSVRVVMRNPVTMAAWGLIVAVGLVAGSIPLLLGLIFVMPVLGHATWHLYRRAVPR